MYRNQGEGGRLCGNLFWVRMGKRTPFFIPVPVFSPAKLYHGEEFQQGPGGGVGTDLTLF